jgi:hypothetical protein
VERLFYSAKLVALVGEGRVWLSPEVEGGDYATRRFVSAMAAAALHAQQTLNPAGEDELRFLARWLLMPTTAFARLAHLPVSRLAALFGVPRREVALRREDLLLCGTDRPGPLGRRATR